MSIGPTFDPTAAAAMSSETSRAAQSGAAAERQHRFEDVDAARVRDRQSRPGRLRKLLNRLLRRLP